MATIVHFDLSAVNTERAQNFYQQVFDWKFEKLPGGMDYYFISTSDLEGQPSVGGGMSKREDAGQTGITNFIGVESIDKTIEKVKILGGKILQPKQAVPGWGYMATCTDTENNVFGIFQEDKAAH